MGRGYMGAIGSWVLYWSEHRIGPTDIADVSRAATVTQARASCQVFRKTGCCEWIKRLRTPAIVSNRLRNPPQFAEIRCRFWGINWPEMRRPSEGPEPSGAWGMSGAITGRLPRVKGMAGRAPAVVFRTELSHRCDRPVRDVMVRRIIFMSVPRGFRRRRRDRFDSSRIAGQCGARMTFRKFSEIFTHFRCWRCCAANAVRKIALDQQFDCWNWRQLAA